MNKYLRWPLTLACFFLLHLASAQTDDLMIVEYIDSDPGAGFAITLYNPTPRAIGLSGYRVGTYNNGSTSGTELPLTGSLAPGGYLKVGNTTGSQPYCPRCGCDQGISSAGVNGNDAIVLKGPNGLPVDMIGLYGVDVFNTVAGESQALLHSHLYREATNCIRYSSTDGTSPNSWPNTSAVNVTGWRVEGVTGSEECLKANFAFSSAVAVSLPRDTSICAGSRVTLRAVPPTGLNYSWNTGGTSSSITVDTSGLFIVTASRNGCLSRDSVRVTVNRLPSIRFASRDTSMCAGDSIRLAVADSTGWQYLWSTADTAASIVVRDSGNYILNVVRNSCQAKDSIHVAVRALPLFSLGNDTGFCRNDTLTLALRHIAGQTYEWSTADTTSWLDVTAPGRYSLQVRQQGCRFADTILVTEHALPQVSLGSDQQICQGSKATLAASVDVDPVQLRWSNGDTARTLQAAAGTYWAVAKTAFGCTGIDTVQVSEEAPVRFTLGSDRMVCIDSSVTLGPDAGFEHYLWSTGDTARTLQVNSPGSYSLTGISGLGCESLGNSVVVEQVPCNFTIPNVFTPGNDALNDTWKTAQPFLVQADVKVFNRWGKQVFASTKPDFEWDGADATDGMYFFLIEGTTFEGKAFDRKGWVELVR